MGGGAVSGTFPFSAVVGHDEAKLALLLNAVDPRIGGVLLRGQKGSAKSTLARGLAALLPGAAPFVELPLGATEDRVVGTLDIEAALTAGRRRFQPGLLAQAHGGVLYVDEVNLLADHLVDVLLDVAASGVNRVEREGVSESHPARFVLVGSMNPEEGELRPQLLDRFGLSVEMATSTDPADRADAVRRRLSHDEDGEGFAARWRAEEADLAARLAAARPAALPAEVLEATVALCASLGAEGLRADLVVCRAAAALAGWEGRGAATLDDVRRVAPLALAHRRRRGPFDEAGIDRSEVDEALEAWGAGPAPAGEPPGAEAPAGEPPGAEAPAGEPPGAEAPAGGDRTRTAAADAPGPVVLVQAARSGGERAPAPGRRSVQLARRGRQIGDRPPSGPLERVAVVPTVRAAALRRTAEPQGPLVSPADLREVVAEQKVGNLVVLAVDASGSMGAKRRMEAVKGAAVSLLLDAYQRRDRVSLVTFWGEQAEVALRPTGSVEVARRRLLSLPTGGRTPLGAGIRLALDVARSAQGPYRPLLVLVSDGRATSDPGGDDPVHAALAAAAEVSRAGVAALVVDVEDASTRLGLAGELARHMGARHLTLPQLNAGAVARAVRQAVPQ
jgi:magnesium chelatase subunit D